MADKPDAKTALPNLLQQNPAPVEKPGQDRMVQARAQVDLIMAVFMKVLPSNYVAQIQGPYYTLQYQAVAERIAEFQITAQEVFADSAYEYTRSEFLYQLLGSLVFPDATAEGQPNISGDISYRTFLRRMVALLLKGATTEAVTEGVELLTDATVEVIERAVAARQLPGGRSAWGPEEQYTFEVNVSNATGVILPLPNGQLIDLEQFPVDPFQLLENVRLVLRALKPAHVLYDYRHLFRDAFQAVFTDQATLGYQDYHYQDLRRYWEGATRIAGTVGVTLTDRTLFSDPTRDFSSVLPGAILTILTGPNSIHVGGQEGTPFSTDEGHVGRFRVTEVRVFPVGDDPSRRRYTTTSGLYGAASVVGSDIFDPAQTQWRTIQEGEILTFSEGPNAGSYRLHAWLGNHGGTIGQMDPPGVGAYIPGVRAAPSLLRLRRRMGVTIGSQAYEVTVDRLGMQIPRVVDEEDVTIQFYS